MFYMKTVGAFDLSAGHVHIVLNLEFQHDIII